MTRPAYSVSLCVVGSRLIIAPQHLVPYMVRLTPAAFVAVVLQSFLQISQFSIRFSIFEHFSSLLAPFTIFD